jgi:ribosomal protein L37AE/L43A
MSKNEKEDACPKCGKEMKRDIESGYIYCVHCRIKIQKYYGISLQSWDGVKNVR